VLSDNGISRLSSPREEKKKEGDSSLTSRRTCPKLLKNHDLFFRKKEKGKKGKKDGWPICRSLRVRPEKKKEGRKGGRDAGGYRRVRFVPFGKEKGKKKREGEEKKGSPTSVSRPP